MIIAKFRDLATDSKLRSSKFKKTTKEVIDKILPVLTKVDAKNGIGSMQVGEVPIMPTMKAIEDAVVPATPTPQPLLSLMDGRVSPPLQRTVSESLVSIEEQSSLQVDIGDVDMSCDEDSMAGHMVTTTL